MNRTVLTCSRQNLRNRNKEDPTRSTGVEPAKYPLNVKLERIFTTLECQSWKNYAYLGLWGIWGFYSGIELTFVSWWRRYFLVKKILFNASYIVEFFSCRDSFDYGLAWDARHFHIRFLREHLGHVGATWLYYQSPLRSYVSLESLHYEESVRLTWVRPLQRVRLSFLSETWFPLPVLWLLGYLDRHFWQHCRLWVTLLIGFVCLGIYLYQFS